MNPQITVHGAVKHKIKLIPYNTKITKTHTLGMPLYQPASIATGKVPVLNRAHRDPCTFFKLNVV